MPLASYRKIVIGASLRSSPTPSYVSLEHLTIGVLKPIKAAFLGWYRYETSNTRHRCISGDLHNSRVVPVPASLDEVNIFLEVEGLERIALPIRCYVKDALVVASPDHVGTLDLGRIGLTVDTSTRRY